MGIDVTKKIVLNTIPTLPHSTSFKVEYHANRNPLTNSEKISICWSKVNISNYAKNQPYHASLFFKCHLVFRFLH